MDNPKMKSRSDMTSSQRYLLWGVILIISLTMLILGIVLTARAAKCSTEESETDEDKPDPPALIVVGVLLAISLAVNNVLGIYIATLLRRMQSSRQHDPEEHVYYNSVVKSNLAREKNECITDACVNHPQKQSEGTPPKSVGASVGHYES